MRKSKLFVAMMILSACFLFTPQADASIDSFGYSTVRLDKPATAIDADFNIIRYLAPNTYWRVGMVIPSLGLCEIGKNLYVQYKNGAFYEQYTYFNVITIHDGAYVYDEYGTPLRMLPANSSWLFDGALTSDGDSYFVRVGTNQYVLTTDGTIVY